MCNKVLKYIIGLNIFSFIKKMTTKQHYKLIFIINIIMLLGLVFAREIYRTEGIMKIFIFILLIAYLTILILASIRGIMISQPNWNDNFSAFFYCLPFFMLIAFLLILIYKFFIQLSTLSQL